jgi:hypothetical protein
MVYRNDGFPHFRGWEWMVGTVMYEDDFLEMAYEDRVSGMVMEDSWEADVFEFEPDETDYLDEYDED